MWIVTFSDLMSLLLTFFVLLLSFSTISEEKFDQAMMSLQGALGVLPKWNGIISMTPRPPKKAREEMEAAARNLQRDLQIAGKDEQVLVEYDAVGGLKISLPSAATFDLGSSVLKREAYPLLLDMGEVLADLPGSFIEVRGYTDSQPMGDVGQFLDNYDLSYSRAKAVTARLNDPGGVPMQQFEIIALGPNQPLASNNTEAGRRANRRVEIYVRGLVDKRTLEPLQERARGLSNL